MSPDLQTTCRGAAVWTTDHSTRLRPVFGADNRTALYQCDVAVLRHAVSSNEVGSRRVHFTSIRGRILEGNTPKRGQATRRLI
jgi:hypothetical protein